MNRREKQLAHALAIAARKYPNDTPEELLEYAEELLDDWAADAAHDREIRGEPEDTHCIQSVADVCGGEEGRYHGVIG